MDLTGIILFVVGFILGGGSIWFIRQRGVDSMQKNQDDLKQEFENISNKVFIDNQNQFLSLAKTEFEQLNKDSAKELDGKKELIDSTLKEMKQNLDNLSKNTIALEGQMKESKESVGKLTDTTSQLRQILSSSQARGQWGERMVKDILDFIGLVEKGTCGASNLRPTIDQLLMKLNSIDTDLLRNNSFYVEESEGKFGNIKNDILGLEVVLNNDKHCMVRKGKCKSFPLENNMSVELDFESSKPKFSVLYSGKNHPLELSLGAKFGSGENEYSITSINQL